MINFYIFVFSLACQRPVNRAYKLDKSEDVNWQNLINYTCEKNSSRAICLWNSVQICTMLCQTLSLLQEYMLVMDSRFVKLLLNYWILGALVLQLSSLQLISYYGGFVVYQSFSIGFSPTSNWYYNLRPCSQNIDVIIIIYHLSYQYWIINHEFHIHYCDISPGYIYLMYLLDKNNLISAVARRTVVIAQTFRGVSRAQEISVDVYQKLTQQRRKVKVCCLV